MEHSFFEVINIKNKDSFKITRCEDIKNELRKRVREFVIGRESENEYLDLTSFSRQYSVPDMSIYIDIVGKELEKVGWKWKLGFGETALFIFEKDVPVTCW